MEGSEQWTRDRPLSCGGRGIPHSKRKNGHASNGINALGLRLAGILCNDVKREREEDM
jgi:hypothetical protein